MKKKINKNEIQAGGLKEEYKESHTYINNVVQEYFDIFYSWVPKSKYETCLLKILRFSTWSTIILSLIALLIYNSSQLLGYILYSSFPILVGLAFLSWLVQLLFLIICYWLMSPKNIRIIEQRMKSKFYMKEIIFKVKDGEELSLQVFELEKVWLKNVLGDESFSALAERIKLNTSYREPTSRNVESVVKNTFRNQYVVNLLLVILTVTLTVTLSPLIPSIDDKNFTTTFFALNASALYIWFLIVVCFLLCKLFMMSFIWPFEYYNNRSYVTWQYELFISMLGRHQKLTIKKPKIKYIPKI